MEDQKIDTLLNLALDATNEELEKSEELDAGYNRKERTWEVIVRYSGSRQELLAAFPAVPGAMESVWLSGGYAILTGTRNQIEALAALPQILFVEKPKRLYFSVSIGRSASCLYAVQAAPLELYGEGGLVAVIDSGVDYFHPDFRREDGTTRIRAMWDQSAVLEGAGHLGHRPTGFARGVEYTQAEINAALAAGSREAGIALVPEQDLSGHGTEVLGIAAGNGRSSGNPYRGVAPKSDILVVKLGTPRPDGFPSTTELMEALEYVVRKAEAFAQPVAINLSFGNVYGSHRGTSLLETYIDMLSQRGQNVIVAGTGNEGNSGGHVSGKLTTESYEKVEDTTKFADADIPGIGAETASNRVSGSGGEADNDSVTDFASKTSGESAVNFGEVISKSISRGTDNPAENEFLINDFETTMNLQIWKNYADEFEIAIVHPNGRRAGPFGGELGTARYRLGTTTLLIYYGEPSPYQVQQEIYIDFIPEADYIDSGIWRIELTPRRVISGEYSIWMPDARVRNNGTRFLGATPDTTMTIPSTASGVIAVGAYDARLDSYASFSGRGWPDSEDGWQNRPDLAAPGVDIMTTAAGGGYVSVSGTSFAAPFVTGAAALLMEWGIVRGNDPYLYGEKVRAYLRRGARQLPGFTQWPNNQVGYGALCVRDSLPV
ncbi:MAG: S8 family serine peptidase [Lachnospiraceae bacterium]|nr:S8 family serine peptidase [Lachnospiraceae bacterium]